MNYSIKINNKQVNINKAGLTIIQACSNNNIEVPRFCYHEKLSIAGNCRMCLVEVENSIKPVASCAMPVMPNMKIFTNTKLIKKAREGILEFLLINHPLDCPICDQGGECDLQDQVMVFGSDRGRFYEYKRAVEDKDCGPLIKTLMTRCIHCTRCVRFANEIGGVNFFGVTGRGSKMEIGMYIKQIFESELSGNVIDLCPVGALTSKPYAFVARPWELKSIETFDCLDNLCSKIKIDYRGNNILRVLPIVNQSFNEDWVDDKTRFSFDGFFNKRIETPMMRRIVGSCFSDFSLLTVSWKKVLLAIRGYFERSEFTNSVKGFIGSLIELESAISFKDLLNRLGSSCLFNKDLLNLPTNLHKDFTFKLNMKEIDQVDLFIFIGLNIRIEYPILNSRLRSSIIKGGIPTFSFGQKYNLTYSYKQLGSNINSVLRFIEGKHFLNNFILRAKNPKLLMGSNILNRVDGFNIYSNLKGALSQFFLEDNLSYLNSSIAFFGLKQIGFKLGKLEFRQNSRINDGKRICVLPFNHRKFLEQGVFYYLLGLREFILKKKKLTEFVISQGSHYLNNNGNEDVNILLPGLTYLEQNSTFLDLFNNFKFCKPLFKIRNLQRIDWEIFQMVGILLVGKSFSINLKSRFRAFLLEENLFPEDLLFTFHSYFSTEKKNIFQNTPINELRYNFFEKNLVMQNSINMETCSAQFYNKINSNYNIIKNVR